MTTTTTTRPVILVHSAVKTYGPTHALTGVTLQVSPGEVLGVVGHNGAGKSTLMRLLAGVERPDSGDLEVAEQKTPLRGGFVGVRMAYQETSLAGELTVAHNAYLSARDIMPRFFWRTRASAVITERLDEIFPENSIGADDYVDDLSIAQRQMVEISRATLSKNLRVLILDEPTESLTSESAAQLYSYVREQSNKGIAVVLISHRLNEVLSVSDRIAILKDGAVVSTHDAHAVTEDDLFVAMGGEVGVSEKLRRSTAVGNLSTRAEMMSIDGVATSITAHRGEVIGLAGIAGQGQEQVLERLWRASRKDTTVTKRRAYVPGDRQRSGVLPLWTVGRNLSISSLTSLAKAGWINGKTEAALVNGWVSRLSIRGGSSELIARLSGGNQQKVIVARAFASDAETILLDDPFRGVDIHTKTELYRLIRTEADAGRTIIWYSSENSEMQHCDRVYVLRAGRIAGELAGPDIDDNAIIELSFAVSKEVPE